MQFKIQTDATTPAPGNPRVGSRDHMLELMEAVFKEEGKEYSLFEMPPDRIVGARLVTFDADGRRALKPFHRLDVFQHKFPVNTIVGHLTESHFKGMVRACLLSWMGDLKRLQAGDWRVVAARPIEANKKRWARVPTGNSASTDVRNADINPDRVTGASNPQRTRPQMVNEPYLQLEVVAAEISDAPHIDHEFRRTGRMNGKHYRFSQSGLLVHMHESLRTKRALAIEIVNEVFNGEFETVELSERDTKQIAFMSDSGMPPDLLAVRFGISEQRIEAAIEEAQNLILEERLIAEAKEKALSGAEAEA